MVGVTGADLYTRNLRIRCLAGRSLLGQLFAGSARWIATDIPLGSVRSGMGALFSFGFRHSEAGLVHA